MVADVAAGRGRSAWLEGEPGIGKTALLEVGLRDAEAVGCHLFMGRADETDPMFPLRVLLDALQVGPDATDPARAEIVERLWGGSGAGVMTPMDPGLCSAVDAFVA